MSEQIQFELGDRVWSILRRQWGTVDRYEPDREDWVWVKFDLTKDLAITGCDVNELFFKEIHIPKAARVRPTRPDLKIDDRVLVNNAFPIEWVRGHFAGWTDDGYIKTFLDGLTSWTTDGATCVWTEWKLPDADSEKSEVKNDE
ncbi:MAG: hypothetical protein IPK58_22155 [Acidobacteria bacterium]|nr:hypothetical protein [Acidobacteriota bacterium]